MASTGHLRKRAGQCAEDRAKGLNERCELYGVARIRRLFPECFGIPGKMKFKDGGEAEADYYGIMLDGSGRAVLVECKSCQEARFRFENIEDHQAEALDACEKAGGVAVVLIIGAFDYALPWWFVREMMHGGAISVRLDALNEFRVPTGTPYLARWTRKGGVK